MLRVLSIFCFSIFISFSAASQTTNFVNGYVVTTKGDTLKGLIKKFTYSAKSSSLVVFMDDNEKKTKYKPKDLKSYKAGTDIFVTKIYSRPGGDAAPLIAFMKVMTEGAVNLYQYDYVSPGMPMGAGGMSTGSTVNSSYYIEKPGYPLYFVKKAKFRKEIASFLSESEELLRRLEEEKLKYTDLRMIVNIYNNDMRKK